jgi:hypothetical protein
VKNDRDDCENQQQVNEKTRGVEENKTADPRQNQNKRQYQKHGSLLSRETPPWRIRPKLG